MPFYVALPSPTIDWTVDDGVKEIPIEERSADEVDFIQGLGADGKVARVRISPAGKPRRQPGLRRDAGAARDRAHHRARRRGGLARGAEGAVSRSAASGPAEDRSRLNRLMFDSEGLSMLRPLAGLTIIEFEGIGPGPLAGRMLADHGAEVTAIVRPEQGGDRQSGFRRAATIRCAAASASSRSTSSARKRSRRR